MPVPKKKTSNSRRNMRRSHDALTKPATITCPQCGEPKQLHKVCPSCGKYRGKEIISHSEEE